MISFMYYNKMNYKEKIEYIKDNIKQRSWNSDDIYVGNVIEWMQQTKIFKWSKPAWSSYEDLRKRDLIWELLETRYIGQVLKTRDFKSDPLEEQSEICLDLIIEVIKL